MKHDSRNPSSLDRPATITSSRLQLPTLIGVAPAAPYASGRPSSRAMPAAPALEAIAADRDTAVDGPISRVRPRSDAPCADAIAPKHTFDSIALSDHSDLAPAPRTTRALLLLAVAVVSGVVLAARFASWGAPTSDVAAAASPAPLVAPPPPAPTPTAMAMATATATATPASTSTPTPKAVTARPHKKHAPKHRGH